MKINLTTIASFSNSVDAYLAKTKLDSEGINSFIIDENISSMYPLISSIKLKTKSDEAERALEILGLNTSI